MNNLSVIWTDLVLQDRQEFGYKIGQLLLPPGPIVVYIMSPKIHPGSNVLTFEDRFELSSFCPHLSPRTPDLRR